jgi:hypothetical protein
VSYDFIDSLKLLELMRRMKNCETLWIKSFKEQSGGVEIVRRVVLRPS